MNSILILPEELRQDNTVLLCGERAARALEAHDLKPGLKLAGALLGGLCGTVEVISVDGEQILLRSFFDNEPPPREETQIIIAVPRPQTVKKVLQFAASCGLSAIHFVRSENTQKSYMQSKTLKEKEINCQIQLGLEQAYDSIAPKVSISPSLGEFFKTHDDVLKSSVTLKILAHGPKRKGGPDVSASDDLPSVISSPLSRTSKVIIAIGPEGGWAPHELQNFEAFGFCKVSLGERIFRVEHALVLLMGQIKALRGLSESDSSKQQSTILTC